MFHHTNINTTLFLENLISANALLQLLSRCSTSVFAMADLPFIALTNITAVTDQNLWIPSHKMLWLILSDHVCLKIGIVVIVSKMM